MAGRTRGHARTAGKKKVMDSSGLNIAEVEQSVSTPEQIFAIERYKYILQEISNINQNIYRFLGIYQTLATALIGAELLLVVNRRRWGISRPLSHVGVLGLMILVSTIALFTVLFIVVGVLSWFDYRIEECDLIDRIVGEGFRERPTVRNWYRWYESYIIFFVLATLGLAWWFTLAVLSPAMS